MMGENYQDIKRDSKRYPGLRDGTQGQTNFEWGGSLPKTEVEISSLAKLWLQPTGWQGCSLELVHTS